MSGKTPATPVDHAAYIAQTPAELRPCWSRLRAQLAGTLPDAEEIIAYKMPGIRIGKSVIAGYAAFSKQCGLYLAPSAVKSHAADIAAAGLTATKTGITFSPAKPIPKVDGVPGSRVRGHRPAGIRRLLRRAILIPRHFDRLTHRHARSHDAVEHPRQARELKPQRVLPPVG